MIYGLAEPRSLLLAKGQTLRLFDIKGIGEYLFNRLGFKEQDLTLSPTLPTPPKNTIKTPDIFKLELHIKLKNQVLGSLGELKSELLNGRERVFYMEITLNSLKKIWQNSRFLWNKTYVAYGKYPSVTRDLVIMVDQETPHEHIAQVIQDSSKHLETLQIIDIYTKGAIPKGKKSLGYHLTFKDKTKTLDDQTIDKEYDHIVDALGQFCKGQMRER